MELEIEIKEEPVWLERTANASLTDDLFFKVNVNTTIKCESRWQEEEQTFPLENFQPSSGITHLEEETKSEFAEPEPTRESCADFKDVSPCSEGNITVETAGVLTRRVVHSCDICCKTFNRSSNLQRHLVLHSGKKPYSCTICGKVFADQSHLKTHVFIHSEDKPFKYLICGAGFRTSTYLKLHKVTHSEKRPFACTVCGNTFKRSHDLRNHEKGHTEKRPSSDKHFACSICGNTFKWASNLREHMLLHSQSTPFTCSICEKTFKRSCSLRKHQKIHTDK